MSYSSEDLGTGRKGRGLLGAFFPLRPADFEILSMTEVLLVQKLLCIFRIPLTVTVFQIICGAIPFKLGRSLKIFQ